MGLIDNIFKALGRTDGCVPCLYKITVCSNFGAYVEGVEKIVDITSEKITIRVKNETLVIQGENLKLKAFVNGDAAVTGEVISVGKL